MVPHCTLACRRCTATIFHARRDVLDRLDNVQCRFLRDCNVDEKDALLHFNLAPLTLRRDIAMLGLIHRTVLGKGPPRFKEYFKRDRSAKLRRHCNHLLPVGQRVSAVKRSALGLISVYNLLPADVAEQTTVANFQSHSEPGQGLLCKRSRRVGKHTVPKECLEPTPASMSNC